MEGQYTEMQQRIFKAMATIPSQNLYNYVNNGEVTYSDLLANGLDKYPEKKEYLESKLKAKEQSAWGDAQQVNTPEAYANYLKKFPLGFNSEEAKTKLDSLEDSYWQQIQKQISKEALENYKNIYSNGKYIMQCEALLNDLPWFETIKKNTISDYEEYKRNYPDKHTEEIEIAIAKINEENDWNYAESIGKPSAYKDYLEKQRGCRYKNDEHIRLAEDRSNIPPSQKEIILDNIRRDLNFYKTKDLQDKVKNTIITWEDLSEVFKDEQVEAIKKWSNLTDLPSCPPPINLRKDSTEIYFWGTKGTGKTCVMGSLLSAAKKNKKLSARNCPHRAYLDQLSNLFSGRGGSSICNLPGSTSKDSIAEMNLKLKDSKSKSHFVTFIDLAGEVITGIYKHQNNIPLWDSEREQIDRVLSYLRNSYNNKIHFFIMEYAKAEEEVEELREQGYSGIMQADVLTSIAEYLTENKGLRTSTVGVYGLVSKSDKIDADFSTSVADRPRLAFDYVNNSRYGAFWDDITTECSVANVRHVKTISYSIGDVFTRNLCYVNDRDAMKIINLLLDKTPVEREGLWGLLFR